MNNLQKVLRGVFIFLIVFFSLDTLAIDHVTIATCDLEVQVDTKDVINRNDGELIITITGGSGKNTINIFGEGTPNNRPKATKHEKNLKTGDYIIIVQDDNGCMKHIEATIK